MKATRLARWAGRLLLACGLLSGGVALAQGGPTEPTNPTAVLYNQTSNPGNVVDSSNWGTVYSNFNSQAADDFVVPPGVIWQITSVTASGGYIGVAGSGVLSLLVQFYTNSSASLPQNAIYNQTIASGSIGGLSTGVFVVTLSSPVTLLPGHYWFSAQAREQCQVSNCKHWVWTERTIKAQSESVWENPARGLGPNCPTWKPRVTVCHQPNGSSSPDLLFELAGASIPLRSQLFLPMLFR